MPASSVREDGEPRSLRGGPDGTELLRGTAGAGDSADQIVVAGLLDLDAHDLAGARLSAIDVDLAVDLRRLPHPAAFQEQLGLLGDALDQDVERAPDEGLLVLL